MNGMHSQVVVQGPGIHWDILLADADLGDGAKTAGPALAYRVRALPLDATTTATAGAPPSDRIEE
jgi:hypothetical protein